MPIPFSEEAFLAVFAAYNQAIFPAQFFAYVFGIVAVAIAFQGRGGSSRLVPTILAVMWLWMGVVYHFIFFTEINVAAYFFAALFIIQGALLWRERGRLHFCFDMSLRSIAGGAFIVYAVLVYPSLNVFFGHRYPEMPVFGIAPCPTTIFTFGILLWERGRVPGHLLAIPLLWSVLGVSAAMQLGMAEDIFLVIAGVTGTGLIVGHNRLLKGATRDRG